MGYRIRCSTLFDVTKTGMQHRNKPADMDYSDWVSKRNTQCNLDTILQAISLRSLPELCDDPVLIHLRNNTFDKFGYIYIHDGNIDVPCWQFDFLVQDISVYYDGISKLGSLYSDCDQVPMIKCPTMYQKVQYLLDTSDELKNIDFEVIGYEE